MHVYASVARVNRSDDFGELLGADLLANIATADGHDACGGDRPNKDTSPVGAILSPGRDRDSTRTGKPDAAVYAY